MENLRSIYRLPVIIGFITSSIPFAVCYKCPGVPQLPRMELAANGTQSSQTEIPNRSFPNFFLQLENAHWDKTPLPHSLSPHVISMASCASGQDESNPVMWLATRPGKLVLFCLLGTTRASRKKHFPESHIIKPVLTKLVRSGWLDIGQVLFLRVCGPRWGRGPQTCKNRTRPISSHLDLTLGQ